MKNDKEINWLIKEKYGGEMNEEAKGDIKRLNEGEPLAYIIGFVDFCGARIDLSQRPLIPRPETEFWVSESIKYLVSSIKHKKIRVLDIFAGSGCIGIAFSRHVKNVEVTFADKDKKAIKQIKINLKLNKVAGRVAQSDVFSNITEKYDYIFANPPYIPDYRKNPSASLRAILRNRIQKSVLKYEPRNALFGGENGLFYIKKFLSQAKKHLNLGGRIFMEFSPEQKTAIGKLAKLYGYNICEFHKDQFNRWRWVCLG